MFMDPSILPPARDQLGWWLIYVASGNALINMILIFKDGSHESIERVREGIENKKITDALKL
jgi:hypothetical protein